MFANKITNLMYSDGVVSFDLVFERPGKKPKQLEAVRIDMPFEKLAKVNDILGVELEKIGKFHAEWMQRQLDASSQEKAPEQKPAPKKPAPAKKPSKPRTGRLLKKI